MGKEIDAKPFFFRQPATLLERARNSPKRVHTSVSVDILDDATELNYALGTCNDAAAQDIEHMITAHRTTPSKFADRLQKGRRTALHKWVCKAQHGGAGAAHIWSVQDEDFPNLRLVIKDKQGNYVKGESWEGFHGSGDRIEGHAAEGERAWQDYHGSAEWARSPEGEFWSVMLEAKYKLLSESYYEEGISWWSCHSDGVAWTGSDDSGNRHWKEFGSKALVETDEGEN